jgi:hypothetical protein
MLNHVTFALLGEFRIQFSLHLVFLGACSHCPFEGLGDSNYDTFQGFPKKLFRRLTELGAKPFLPRKEADEATGYDSLKIFSNFKVP